jgi:hypothetical protein
MMSYCQFLPMSQGVHMMEGEVLPGLEEKQFKTM